MFYIRYGIFALTILFGFSSSGYCQVWNAVGEKNGNAIYYSDDGKGYYRKVSEQEILQNDAIKVYLVLDDSGYYHNHIDEMGGGGSYSTAEPDNLEKYSDNNYKVSYIIIYPNTTDEKNEYKWESKNQLTDEQITESEINVAALYPIYFDGF